MAVPLIVASLILEKENPQIDNILTANTKYASSRVALKQINEATQYSLTVCETNCTQLTENITVIISPGSYVGPVTFTQLCQITDINCAISSLVDIGIKKSLIDMKEGKFTKTVSAGAIFGLTPNYIISDDSLDISLKNNVYQLISSSCIFETNQLLSNNYVYVGTGATTGAISFAQSSIITSTDCAIDIIAKNNSYQVDDTKKSTPILVLVIIAIIFIVFIAIIFVIIILLVKANRKSKNKYIQLNKKIYDKVENYQKSTYPTQSFAHR